MYTQRRSRRRLSPRIALAAMAVALVAAACGGSDTTDNSPGDGSNGDESQETATLRFQNCVGVLQVAVAPLVIGQELGFLEEEGIGEIVVNNTGTGSTATCVQLTANGQADVASPVPESLLNALAQGVDLGVKCGFNSIRQPTAAIAVDPDGPYEDYADLEGQTIGVHDLSSAYIPIFEQALEEHGVDPESVEYQVTGFGAQALNALRSGDVAASVYWDYEMGTWDALGNEPKLLPLPEAIADLFSSCLIFSDETIEQRPELVSGYSRAVAKSIIFAEENPEAAVKLFWKFAPETKPTGMSEEEALTHDTTIMQSRLVNHLPADDDPDPRWGAWAPEQWTSYLEFLELDTDLDVESLYTLDFVDEINDFDEEAVREFAREYEVDE